MKLLALIPAKAWEYLGALAIIGLALALFGGYMYVKGGEGPKAALAAETAKFEAFTAQVKTLGEQAQKTAAEKERRDALLKEKSDAKLAADVKDISDRWAADRAERDRLRKQLAGAGSGPVPQVSIGAGLSCGSTSDATISAAVSGYIEAARRAFDDCRAAATDFRNSVALQLEQAEVNTAALSCGVTWASQIR